MPTSSLPTAWKAVALRLYRLAVVVAIVWMIREQHTWLRNFGDLPIQLTEVKSFLPAARFLSTDLSPRGGMRVLDGTEREIGYVLRTSPVSDKIIGYIGPTDTLVALNAEGKVVGIKIRRTWDTRDHVEDVKASAYFLKTWNGLGWDEIATMNLKKAGVEGVSGASLTSMCIAESIVYRFQHSQDMVTARLPVTLHLRDLGLAAVIGFALLLTFTGLRTRLGLRRAFQVVLIGYVGFMNGDLLAQSLLMGWATSGVAWRLAPGLVLLVAAAIFVPWVSGRSLYCTDICPHGAAQELLGRLIPWKLRLRADVIRGLRWLPWLLLGVIVLIVMLNLPLDLAEVEPFDAYIIKTAGAVSIAVAVVGLVASLFVPMAYCKYGCPTGALLEFFRSRGQLDHWSARDLGAGLLVVGVAIVYWQYPALAPLLGVTPIGGP